MPPNAMTTKVTLTPSINGFSHAEPLPEYIEYDGGFYKRVIFKKVEKGVVKGITTSTVNTGTAFPGELKVGGSGGSVRYNSDSAMDTTVPGYSSHTACCSTPSVSE